MWLELLALASCRCLRIGEFRVEEVLLVGEQLKQLLTLHGVLGAITLILPVRLVRTPTQQQTRDGQEEELENLTASFVLPLPVVGDRTLVVWGNPGRSVARRGSSQSPLPVNSNR